MSLGKIVFNGQTYASLDDMPPDVRRAFELAMQALSRGEAGAPDRLEPIDDGVPIMPQPTWRSRAEPAPGPGARPERWRQLVAYGVLGLVALALVAGLVLVAMSIFAR